MSLVPGGASSSTRWTLVSVLGVALVVVVPSLLTTTFDAPATVTLALVALALASLVRFGNHGGALAARTISVLSSNEGDLIAMPARVTDPVHHPLRPRAPGTV